MSDRKDNDIRYSELTDEELLKRALRLSYTFDGNSLVAEIVSRFALYVERGDKKVVEIVSRLGAE